MTSTQTVILRLSVETLEALGVARQSMGVARPRFIKEMLERTLSLQDNAADDEAYMLSYLQNPESEEINALVRGPNPWVSRDDPPHTAQMPPR